MWHISERINPCVTNLMVSEEEWKKDLCNPSMNLEAHRDEEDVY
jgi:hypothetical protein